MRGAYAKPSIQRVQLKAEEAVLTACKSWSNSGSGAYMGGLGGPPNFGNCQQVEGPTTRCNIIGS